MREYAIQRRPTPKGVFSFIIGTAMVQKTFLENLKKIQLEKYSNTYRDRNNLMPPQKFLIFQADYDRPLIFSLVLMMLFVVAITSISQLNAFSLWVDEGWTISVVQTDSLSNLLELVREDVHPPFYFFQLFLWSKLAGDSIFALRYLALLSALLALALTYRLGHDLFSPRVGLYAAGLLALHDLFQVLSKEIRQYPQTVLWSALAIWFYWRFLQKRDYFSSFLFAAAALALIYTHYWGAFILLGVGGHFLLVLLNEARSQRSPLFVQFGAAVVLIVLCYMPWLPVIQDQINDVQGGLNHAFTNNWENYKIIAYQLIGIPEILFLLLTFFGTLRWQHNGRPTITFRTLLPLSVLITTFGLTWLLNTVYTTLWYRSLIVILPAFVLLVAHALAQFRGAAQVVMVAVVLAQSLFSTGADTPPRWPWPDVGDFLADHSTEADMMLYAAWFETYSASYYVNAAGSRSSEFFAELWRIDNDIDDVVPEIARRTADAQGLWMIKDSFDPTYSEILRAQGWQQTAQVLWGTNAVYTIELLRFDRPPQEPPLHRFDLFQLRRAQWDVKDETFSLSLLWEPTTEPERNYTVSAFLLDATGALVSQHDSYPLDGRNATLGWQAGGLYFDAHALDISSLPAGSYRIGLKVYYFSPDFSMLTVVNCNDDPACKFIIIGEIVITP